MSNFEAIGIDYQYNARTIAGAKRAFEISCNKCTTTGKHIECAKCAIASVHNNIVNYILKK